MRSACGSDFPHWDSDSAEICERIARVHSPIKILLKTKNEPFFIERWIAHHAKIVGPENLIVFDNMSDDPQVLAVYRKWRREVSIARFGKFWLNIHHTYLYGDLYRALATSCDYFLFLDTDEFLILMNGDQYYRDDRIITFVEENSQYDLFPAAWLINANWSAELFSCGPQAGDLARNLACGKPLIRSDKIPTGFSNHNFQLGVRLFVPPFKANLFLLHLSHLYPRQRMAANMNKLVAAAVATPGQSPESIALRTDITDRIMAGYVDEIRDCLAAERASSGVATLGPGCLELSKDAAVAYYGEAERNLITDYIADPRPVYDLIGEDYRLQSAIAANLGRPGDLGKLYI